MNELLLCAIFIPLLFLAPRKNVGAIGWVPVICGVACTSYFFWLHVGESTMWGGVTVLLAMTVSEALEKKSLSVPLSISALFFAQSLLTPSTGIVILCIAFGDLFLNIEIFVNSEISEKNRAIQNICKGLFSVLPVTFGVLLGVGNIGFIGLMAVTTVLRLFSWPLPRWISEKQKDPSYFKLLVSTISCFALWHVQDFSTFPEWPMIWLAIVALLSLGSEYAEVYAALTLAVFSLSPVYGLLGATFWPLLVHRGKSAYLVTLVALASGVLVCDVSSRILSENTVYTLGALTAIILARPFAFYEIENRLWVNESKDIFLSLVLLGFFIYFLPVKVPDIGPAGSVFAGSFLLSFIVVRSLRSKHLKFFSPFRGLKDPLDQNVFVPGVKFNERAGTQINLDEGYYLSRFYSALESESYLVWLLGLLGVAIYWGLK